MSLRQPAKQALACMVTVLFFSGQLFAAELDPDLLAGLKARAVGPAGMSGRIAAVDAVADDPNHIVVGAATGGVWISDDGGLTWSPVFDEEGVHSIGSVAINQNNPDIIWVGTGEGNVRNSTSIGGGIYKSVDGGSSWKRVGLESTERINRLALHPTNPDIVYAAAMGTLWGENEDRGVYKTSDGGKTWSKILYVDEKTGASDIVMDPNNPMKLFAAMWQFRRWPYFFKSGGPGSGLYVSYDAGENWDRLTEEDGLPTGELGRAAFAISKADSDRVYALVEAEESALVRSTDGGKTWDKINTDHDINDRPFYYNDLAVDPANPDRIYRIGSRIKVSIDGGKTFQFMPAIDCCAPTNTIHIDNHAWWINPNDPRHMIDGNDGGLAITRDRGETWRFVRNLPLAQFYHIAVDNDDPYHIYGGLQDNGSWRGPAEVRENAGIRNLHWQEVGFGDGFDTRPDPRDSRQGYSMSQGGNLVRWNLDNGELRSIRPNPPEDGTELRFNWDSALALDPFDPDTIYYGSQFVHKSTDRGATWEIISPDLTTNDPEKQTFRKSGGLTPDVTAAENYTTLVSIAPSSIEQDVIWTGSDDGRVHVTRDGGSTWQSVEDRARGFDDGAWIKMIDPSPHDASVAFITVDDHRRSDMNTYVYRVEDYGRRWVSLVSDDLSGYALSIRQDPVDPELLFLGTETGLYVSLNGGDDWVKWTQGVPTASVMDLAIQERENDLVIGTHGRAAFVIDDYAALRNLSAGDFESRFRLLGITDGQQYDPTQTPSTRFPGSTEFRAPNEPYGAAFTFIAAGDDLPHPNPQKEKERKAAQRLAASGEPDADLEDKDGQDGGEDPTVTVTIRDSDGNELRRFKHPVHQGVNRIVWGLEADGVQAPPPAEPDELGNLPAGPEVPPGRYSVELSFDDLTEEAAFRVLSDPRTGYSIEARQANFDALMQIQNMQKAAFESIARILKARRDVDTILTLARDAEEQGTGKDVAALIERAETVKEILGSLEERFRVPPKTRGIVYSGDKVLSRIFRAASHVGSTFDAPSPTSLQFMEIAQSAVNEALVEVNDVITKDLPALRDAVTEAELGLLKQQPVESPAL